MALEVSRGVCSSDSAVLVSLCVCTRAVPMSLDVWLAPGAALIAPQCFCAPRGRSLFYGPICTHLGVPGAPRWPGSTSGAPHLP